MGRYYESTPWVIPEAPLELISFLKSFGKMVSFNKGEVISGPLVNASSCNVDQLIFLESGMLSQCYNTHDINKPKSISLVLPNRILNYLSFMGICNNKENIIALRKSIVYKIPIELAHKLIKNEQDKMEMFNQYFMACIASDYDGFTCMFTCNTEKRLAFLFNSLAMSFNCDIKGEWSNIPLKLSYSELSAVMYTTQKTIERIIPEWKLKGYIQVYKYGFSINNNALNAITEVY
ncbi:Crp/Fnr family transcriptional regulator [Shewanella electrodiphila]|uniref:Crp/Fnr family transcriptional regulator n=1 Tax=Shewanella electrodiphila TaxID=934143 RepID=A0ABT0KRR5_9GAMM|nr:Crp/Fnr family transcriptional regulator [Shewanella electrodiphila]MCL1046543.1 Crp/Fnr family transcriptional regulator [Shewanella electrodiphila]